MKTPAGFDPVLSAALAARANHWAMARAVDKILDRLKVENPDAHQLISEGLAYAINLALSLTSPDFCGCRLCGEIFADSDGEHICPDCDAGDGGRV